MVIIPNAVTRFFRPMNYYRFFLWRVKVFQIFFHSRIINRKLTNLGKKGLFLDCGSNVGQGFEFFRRYYPNKLYDYVLFEPNPYCFEVLKGKYAAQEIVGVHLKNVAVGIEDTNVDFYGIEDEKGGIYSVGGSVLPEHNSKIYTIPNRASLQVVSINFGDFLLDILKKNSYPFVILKLDIEGGEYQVLDSLLAKDLICRFESIYVEFHSQYMDDDNRQIYRAKEKFYFQYVRDKKARMIKWI
jgi:FkbM family methyltransferase